MKVNDWLQQAVQTLEKERIPSARLDALILLEDSTGKDRSWLLAHPEFSLETDIVRVLEDKIDRRSKHEPLAYIRGCSEFYGRTFKVTPATLQPRSETETMLEVFHEYSSRVSNIIDVGTGSGAIAVTAKLEHPALKAYATEINKDALKIALFNAENLSADVNFYQGSLLECLPDEAYQYSSAILANLPYVPDDFTINESAMQEPAIAIFGGNDGLDLYRDLFLQAAAKEHISHIFTESLPFQHQQLAEIAFKSGFKLELSRDLIQVFTAED